MMAYSNVDVDEVDQETSLKLKGDVIGDTLYSQSFVLKTLLKLSNLVWNEQLEEDLCFLWDMTIEKDVCEYLFEINYPSIACSAISMYNENRFIEIVIGTLANITCAGCDKSLNIEEINIVLREFETDDPLILLQLLRFISACAHASSTVLFVNEDIMNKICFVLNNSINYELLLKALEATAKLTVDFKLAEELVHFELYNAVITAYCTMINFHHNIDSEEKMLSSRYMLESITNICSYIDHFKNDQLLLDIKENISVFLHEVKKILKYLSQEQNVLPVSDNVIFFVSAFRYILINLGVDYSPELLIYLTKFLYIVSNIRDDVPDLFESLLELEFYIISRGPADKLVRDLKQMSDNKIKKIADILAKNHEKFDYEINWREIFMQIE